MAGSNRRVKREIRRNLPKYDASKIDTAAIAHSTTSKIFCLILVVLLPLTALFAASNLVLRTPYLYQFDFDRTESYRAINLTLGTSTGTELSTIVSKYMMHRTDKFAPAEKVVFQGEESSVFTPVDQAAMQNARSLLDRFLVAMLIFVLASGGMIYFLVKYSRRKDLWIGYNVGLVFYGFISLFVLVLGAFPRDRNNLFQWAVNAKFSKTDILPQLFDNGFYFEAAVMIVAISAIALFVGRSLIKGWAVRNQMF